MGMVLHRVAPLTAEAQAIVERRLAPDLMKQIFDGTIPRFVFKYRSVQEALDIINSNCLYFATAEELNDPFECRARIQIDDKEALRRRVVRDMLPGFIGSLDETQDLFKDVDIELIQNRVLDVMRQNAGIFCCSLETRNILMWSYYAENHSGVCLGFDMTKHPELFCPFGVVSYSKDYPVFHGKDNSDEAGDEIWNLRQTKFSEWWYEKECRIVKSHLHGNISFNKSALCSVIFGLRTSKADVDKIMYAIDKMGYSVEFRKIKQHSSRYELILAEYEC